MNCQDFEELLGAYTLDALSVEEREAVDAHLSECPKCRQAVQQLQEIVDLFPLSVPAVDPPSHLKSQIFARIQASQEASSPLQPATYQPAPVLRSLRSRKQRVQFSLLAASLLLFMILLGSMFVWNLSLRQQVSQLAAQIPSPITSTIHVTSRSSRASGELLYYPQQHITVLILRGLPQLNGTQVYQGWLLQGKQTKSIGILNVQNGVATLDFQGNVGGYDATAVSLEKGPTASRNSPRGPIVAVGAMKIS
jgi:anti-sigma-K factor RskA